MKSLGPSQHYRIEFELFKGPLNWDPLCRETPITQAMNEFFFSLDVTGSMKTVDNNDGVIMIALLQYYLKNHFCVLFNVIVFAILLLQKQ